MKRSLLPRPKVCTTKPPTVPPVPPPPPPDYLFWDQFNGPPGGPLEGHTPDYDLVGDGWDIKHGGYTIETDEAKPFAGIAIPRNIAVARTEEGNVLIEGWIFTGSQHPSTVGIIYSWGSNTHFSMFDLYVGGKKLRDIHRRGSSWWIPRQWNEPTLAPDTLYKLDVWRVNDTASCRLDNGGLHVSFELCGIPPRLYGIYAHDKTSIRHHEFKISISDGP